MIRWLPLTVAILTLGGAAVHAQVRPAPEALSVLIANSPLASQPFGADDVIPVIQNWKLRHLPVSGTGAVMLPDASNVVLPDARTNLGLSITGLIKGNGTSAPAAYSGTSCTNQFPRSLDLNGVATCATVSSNDLAASLALVTPDIGAATGTSLILSGSLLGKVALSSKVINYAVLAADNGTHFDNIGAAGDVTFTLPPAAAGLNYCFSALEAQTVTVAASGSDKIALGAGNTAAGGNVTSNVAFRQGFPSVCIEAHGTVQWIAPMTPNGQWAMQ